MPDRQSEDHCQGLSQRQLCDRFGWSYRAVALTAKKLGFSTHTYLQQQTGWQLYRERWYPPTFDKL